MTERKKEFYVPTSADILAVFTIINGAPSQIRFTKNGQAVRGTLPGELSMTRISQVLREIVKAPVEWNMLKSVVIRMEREDKLSSRVNQYGWRLYCVRSEIY